ncbi:hypothetical protein SLEP1_g40450 [Rubroshorea leprosula]|uniref:Uncharacterized protein n=1 Tax=Rubroshorea leprosula TaxID=152421 RepID=A0AAV5L414_9ROSI|nr:hypothetical protein SLEP1_g40450 [Rubroshorea leprosula]
MENLTVVLRTRAVRRYAIASGRVSASNRHFVERMPRIQPGQNSRPFLARDMYGHRIYHLKYKRRMVERRPKQTITGLGHFFQEHGLQPGDRIILYKEEGNEVILMGKLISPLYVIHFEKGVDRSGTSQAATSEGRRGTDDRWNGGKEDPVFNRAVVMRPSGLVQRKESREVGGVVEQRGSPLPALKNLPARFCFFFLNFAI